MELNDVIVNQPVVIDNVNILIFHIYRSIFCRIGVNIFHNSFVLLSNIRYNHYKIL